MKFQLVCFIAVLGSSLAAPPFKKCPPSDPNVNECLKGAINGALKELAHGSKFDLIDMEPILYDKIAILDTDTGPFRGKLIYKDISLTGFTGGQVKKIEKKSPGVLQIEFYFPATKISGKYKMDTVLLAVPMKGDGDFTLESKGVTINFEFHIKEKNGFYEVTDITQPFFDVDFLQIHHTNLFNGNKALGDNVNKLLNQQWRVLAKELGPITVNSFTPVYLKVSNEVLRKISSSEFPIPL